MKSYLFFLACALTLPFGLQWRDATKPVVEAVRQERLQAELEREARHQVAFAWPSVQGERWVKVSSGWRARGE